MAQPHMKARVFAEPIPAGHGWTYEIFDPSKPEGHQIAVTGMRPTWEHAMESACQFLSRYAQTRRMLFKMVDLAGHAA